MKVKACNDKYFGDALCTNQVAFTLTIMYPMDLVLFFLDTFLWWILWNVFFSITRSFFLGLCIWTPWREIYTRLLKRIHSKLLAIPDLGSSINQGLHSLGASPPLAAYRLSPGPCVTDLECCNHLDVSRTPPFHRPRPTAPLPSSRYQ